MNTIDLNPAVRPASAVMPALSQDIMVLLFGALLAMTIAWAILVKIRQREDRAIILLGCGVAACLLEGFACYLIQCYHSPIGEYCVYRAFDTHVPLWLAEVYVLFFGAAVYFLQKMLLRSTKLVGFWVAFTMIGVSEGLFEIYGIHQGMFLYYGAQPFPLFGFPLHLGFVNPTLAIGISAMSATWFHFARGGIRYLLIPLTPFLFFGIYASLVTPVAAALHEGSQVLAAAGGLCTIAASLSLATIAFWTLRKLQPVNLSST